MSPGGLGFKFKMGLCLAPWVGDPIGPGGEGGAGLDITATITITMDYAALIIYSTMNPDRTTANQQQLFWRGPDTQMTCSDGEHEGGDSYFYKEIIMGLVSIHS